MKYKTVLFDFDGTLADTSPGIFYCVKKTFERLGKEQPTQEQLIRFLGPPLQLSFRNVFDATPEQALAWSTIYREIYAAEGIHMTTLFPGMMELVQTLKEAGIQCGVASAKKELTLGHQLSTYGLAPYFDFVCGAWDTAITDKTAIIEKAVDCANMPKEQCVLVGDSPFDAIGAAEAGIDFCATTWGGVFAGVEDPNTYACVHIAHTAADVQQFLMG